jgi:fibrillarin-like pre-rRNA processing protein
MGNKKFLNDNVRFIKDKLYSKSIDSKGIYGEKVIKINGENYRLWDPKRSKLSAAIIRGYADLPILEDSSILYLGASFGTTVSHISDMIPEGQLFAVEFSAEPFAGLLKLSEQRSNIYPILENARNPEKFGFFIERDPEIIYQDISQRDQLDILFNNMDQFPQWQNCLFVLKATSVDSAKIPTDVLESIKLRIKQKGNLRIISITDISNFHKGHFFLHIQNNSF